MYILRSCLVNLAPSSGKNQNSEGPKAQSMWDQSDIETHTLKLASAMFRLETKNGKVCLLSGLPPPFCKP